MPKVTEQRSFAATRINKRDMESQVVRSGTEGKQSKSKVSKPKPVKPVVKRSSAAIKKP